MRGESLVESAIALTLARIATDNRSGAAQIAEHGADVLVQRANAGEASSPDAFRQAMLDTGWALIQAQTVMAPLVTLVNSVLWRIEECEDLAGLRRAVTEAAADFKHELRQHAQQVAEKTLALIGENSTVITLSQSSTVQRALLHAQRAGRHFAVICAESRPACEGRETAELLARHGIPTTLVVDAAAIAAVADADLVLVGADLLSSDGLVNKIGTLGLAHAARACGVPLYPLCSSEKFLPPGYPMPDQRDWPADEVWPDAPAGVAIRNRYFDLTPLSLISNIVTERGILPPEAIEAWLATTRLHPALAARVAEHEALPL
jgi:translation initiation factor eIF-2B subunit delta